MQELHNELVAPASEGGLEEEKYRVTGGVIISNTMIINIIPGNIISMQENH